MVLCTFWEKSITATRWTEKFLRVLGQEILIATLWAGCTLRYKGQGSHCQGQVSTEYYLWIACARGDGVSSWGSAKQVLQAPAGAVTFRLALVEQGHTTVQNANRFCFQAQAKLWQHLGPCMQMPDMQNRLSSTLCTGLALAATRLQLKCILVVAPNPLLLRTFTLWSEYFQSLAPHLSSCIIV